jgi:hypothetical protein
MIPPIIKEIIPGIRVNFAITVLINKTASIVRNSISGVLKMDGMFIPWLVF